MESEEIKKEEIKRIKVPRSAIASHVKMIVPQAHDEDIHKRMQLLGKSRSPKEKPQGIQFGTKPQGLFGATLERMPGFTPDDIESTLDTVATAVTYKPRLEVVFVSLAVFIFLVILGVWAAFAQIDEVTHADGTVIGSRRTQAIQNLEGGILRALFVHEGQIVERDTLLARLDNSQAKAGYRDAINRTVENIIALECYEAELASREPVFPKDIGLWIAKIIGQYPDDRLIVRAKRTIEDEEAASISRRRQLQAEIDVLQAQLEQRTMEVKEQRAKKVQLEQSYTLAKRRRDMAYNLVRRNNFSQMEFITIEQELVDLTGQLAQVTSSIPKAEAGLAESEQRIQSRQAEWKKNISAEINKRRAELASIRETLRAGGDQITRTEIRSPIRGTVRQIYTNSIGGVIRPGETLMDIVPDDDTLLVEARVMPKDVAFLHPGQHAVIKITAYDYNIYGGLDGTLESISADTIEDKRGNFYYNVKIRTPRAHLFYRNEVLPIIPGMVVSADILIGKKSVLDYILAPIRQAQENALRER